MLAYTHITQVIVRLLYKHDCVIVPGFGGYVARQHPAAFSASSTLLSPPSKSILFNRNLIHNDGLLAAAVMEEQDLAFDAANALLADYAAYCKAMLQAKNRLELRNLGLFYLDAENTLRFEPETDVNFLIESFGLSPVLMHPLEEETPAITPRTPVFEDRTPETLQPAERPVLRPKRHYARVAAWAVGIPAALALLLMAATSRPMKPLLESSLNPFYSAEKTYSPVHYNEAAAPALHAEKQRPLLADANGYATFTLGNAGHVMVANISDTLAKADKTAVTPKPAIHRVRTSAFDGTYQVVVGCFGVKENAERLIRELQHQHIDAGISGTNAKGLHVVSCGGFNSREDAMSMLNVVRGSYPNAWVMAR